MKYIGSHSQRQNKSFTYTTHRNLLKVLLIVSASLFPAHHVIAQSNNLVKDGSFEVDPTEAKDLINRVPPTNIGAWELDFVSCRYGCGAQQRYTIVENKAGGYKVPDGDFALNIGNSFNPGVARQVIFTTPNQQYTLSLHSVNGAGIDGGRGSVRIYNSKGNDLDKIFTNGFQSWKKFQYTFTATAAMSMIEFTNLGNGGVSSGSAMFIDDIRVEPIGQQIRIADPKVKEAMRQSSALIGDNCVLVLPATSCTVRINVQNPELDRLCLWGMSPLSLLTCHGAVAT